ncbi:MAG TPA: TMEM175 family protein [Streptosporangiaceae bacterium]|nr:TMEM175 family protein [Streptosporangiaceae bacterium]
MTDGGEPPAGAVDPPAAAADPPIGTDGAAQRGRRVLSPLSVAGNLEYDRVLFFSDAVFAIAITLLVVDIRVPDVVINSAQQIHHSWDKILSFTISFLVIGLFWMGHHRLFRYITALDRRLIFLNLLFLGTIAFLPYPTALLFAGSTKQPAGTVFYASCVAGAGLVELVVWLYATHTKGLVPASIPPAVRRYELAQLLPSPVVFLLSIPVAFAAPSVAPFTWILLLPIGRLLPRIMRAKPIPGDGG